MRWSKQKRVNEWRAALAHRIAELLPEEAAKAEYRGGLIYRTRPGHGWPAVDDRFAHLFNHKFMYCATYRLCLTKHSSVGRRASLSTQVRTRCRGKPVIRLGGKWWCRKCCREQPLPLWDGAELLHMRPLDVRRIAYRPAVDPNCTLSQGECQSILDVTADGLWALMGAWPHLPACVGAVRVPYRFCPIALEVMKEMFAHEAGLRLGSEGALARLSAGSVGERLDARRKEQAIF